MKTVGYAGWSARKERSMLDKQQGFSLIELLIVVAIILIIASISIPNLLRSRMAANEASAVGSMRTINTACITYSTVYGIGFPSALSNLGTSGATSSTSADLIDNVLAGGAKSGYTFTYVAGTAAGGVVPTYALNAGPISPGQTGQRYFFTDQSGVIRFNVSAAATVSDSPLQ
jgi:prepilin-type N-terminal cleavage/methylation domain-containing protein